MHATELCSVLVEPTMYNPYQIELSAASLSVQNRSKIWVGVTNRLKYIDNKKKITGVFLRKVSHQPKKVAPAFLGWMVGRAHRRSEPSTVC